MGALVKESVWKVGLVPSSAAQLTNLPVLLRKAMGLTSNALSFCCLGGLPRGVAHAAQPCPWALPSGACS